MEWEERAGETANPGLKPFGAGVPNLPRGPLALLLRGPLRALVFSIRALYLIHYQPNTFPPANSTKDSQKCQTGEIYNLEPRVFTPDVTMISKFIIGAAALISCWVMVKFCGFVRMILKVKGRGSQNWFLIFKCGVELCASSKFNLALGHPVQIWLGWGYNKGAIIWLFQILTITCKTACLLANTSNGQNMQRHRALASESYPA